MSTNFNNSFTVAFSDKPQKKLEQNIPPHLKLVAALPAVNNSRTATRSSAETEGTAQ